MRDLIEELAAKFNNRDSIATNAAVRNFRKGLPAFWSNADHSDNVTGARMAGFNRHGGIQAALDYELCADEVYSYAVRDMAEKQPGIRRSWQDDWRQTLNSLIPLNHQAALEIVSIYSQLGDLREVSEIAQRLYDHLETEAEAA